MKNIVYILMVCLLLLTACNSQDKQEKQGLSNYPDFFIKEEGFLFFKDKIFDAIIVVSETGPEEDLITGQDFLMHLMEKYTINDYTLLEYDQIGGIYDKNAIFIGTCHIKVKNKFVNLFMDCLSMEENVGMIRLVEKDDIKIIQVVGYELKDTREAVSVLMNYKDYDLSGKEIQVRGDAGNLTIRITGR